MKRSFLFACFAFVTIAVKAQYVGLSDKEIESLKSLVNTEADAKKYYLDYLKLADQAVNENPNPIDTIRSEGLLQGDPKKAATSLALKDLRKMYALAIVYRVTGEKSYLQNLSTYLTTWARANKSKGDPIDDTNIDAAVEAFDMVKDKMKPNDKALVTTWFTQIADAEMNTFKKKPGSATAFNNWNSHRLKEVGEIAVALNIVADEQWVIDGLKMQLQRNLEPDGSSVDFKLRDALHYHVYDLEPLLKLAIILKRATGVDYYAMQAESGASIQKSVEWLVPYLTGEKTHGEFVNSTVKFDLARAKNGEADYKAGTLFNPKNGLKTLGLAAYFDPKYYATIKTVKGTDNNFSDWQLVLNKVMGN